MNRALPWLLLSLLLFSNSCGAPQRGTHFYLPQSLCLSYPCTVQGYVYRGYLHSSVTMERGIYFALQNRCATQKRCAVAFSSPQRVPRGRLRDRRGRELLSGAGALTLAAGVSGAPRSLQRLPCQLPLRAVPQKWHISPGGPKVTSWRPLSPVVLLFSLPKSRWAASVALFRCGLPLGILLPQEGEIAALRLRGVNAFQVGGEPKGGQRERLQQGRILALYLDPTKGEIHEIPWIWSKRRHRTEQLLAGLYARGGLSKEGLFRIWEELLRDRVVSPALFPCILSLKRCPLRYNAPLSNCIGRKRAERSTLGRFPCRKRLVGPPSAEKRCLNQVVPRCTSL